MVVNSPRRSRFFSIVGRRVFFSQACSLAEGLRRAEEVSAGDAVCVVPFDSSLMGLAPGGRNQTTVENATEIQCYSKGTEGARAACGQGPGRGRQRADNRGKSRPGNRYPSRPEKVPGASHFWPDMKE